jgi:HEAT repeat protein
MPMPLIKRDAKGPPSPPAARPEGLAAQVAALASSDAEARWSAARALGGHADAATALGTALRGEPEPRVREAITTALLRIGTAASVAELLPCLRSQDAGLRAAAIEALQALPEAVTPFVQALFADADSDVRILATELTRNMPAADATALLCGLITHETHPNVCAAAVEVLSEVGTPDALPVLRDCETRFADQPFLPFAITTAIARISGQEG